MSYTIIVWRLFRVKPMPKSKPILPCTISLGKRPESEEEIALTPLLRIDHDGGAHWRHYRRALLAVNAKLGKGVQARMALI